MDVTQGTGKTAGMDEDTETEALLREAREIAQRQIEEPGQDLVLAVFRRLCYENDYTRDALGIPFDRTLH